MNIRNNTSKTLLLSLGFPYAEEPSVVGTLRPGKEDDFPDCLTVVIGEVKG